MSDTHMHAYLYLWMPEGKDKCIKYSLFFTVYIRECELGFCKLCGKLRGSIQVIQVQCTPST